MSLATKKLREDNRIDNWSYLWMAMFTAVGFLLFNIFYSFFGALPLKILSIVITVLLIGGLSLGGQVLLEMLSRRGDVCRHALVESATVLPSRLTHALIGPSLACSYGLIRRRSFARLQFRSLRLKPELFEEYYRDSSAISRA